MNSALLAVSAIALGQALQVDDGLYSRLGVLLLTIAVAACAAAFAPRLRARPWNAGGVLAFGLLLEFFELFVHRPGSATALARGVSASMFLHASLGIAMPAAAMVVFGAKSWRIAFFVAVAAQLAAAFWIIRATPGPHMDVWWAQQAGLEALSHGDSPFSSRYRDIYGGAAWYPPSMRDGPWILVGFPYPPLALLVVFPSYLLAGDLRYGNAIAFALAAVLIAQLSKTRVAALSALILLFSPRALYLIESGWIEPSVILFFAFAVFCAARFVKGLPFALGLAFVSKQNMPVLLPLVLLLKDQLRAVARKPVLLACALVGPVLSLAAVLPDLRAFIKNAITFPAELALRTDVLSYPAMLANELGFQSSAFATIMGFALAGATIVTMLVVAPRTAAGFAAAAAATLLAFFAFNKYAALNYYFLVIAALCCAVAAQAEGEIDPLLAIT